MRSIYETDVFSPGVFEALIAPHEEPGKTTAVPYVSLYTVESPTNRANAFAAVRRHLKSVEGLTAVESLQYRVNLRRRT